MSGPKRNQDKLNTIGIVVVGICGAVLVYVTIVALQAFYVNDTADVQLTADYGGQDTSAKSLRAAQAGAISDYATNPRPAAPKPGESARPQTYHVPIDVAMKRVLEEAKTDQSSLIPSLGRSDKATVLPIFGRPKLISTPAAAPAAAAGEAPAAGSAAGSAAAPAAGAGSAAGAAVDVPATPLVPTGAGTGPSPVVGAGALDAPSKNPAPRPGAPAPTGAPAAPAGSPPVHAGPAGAAAPAIPAGATGSAAPKGNGK